MMTIGEKIKESRKKNGLTQQQLADYLCVSYQAVSKWETNASSPDLSLIVPLTKLLHLTADELLSPCEGEPDARYEELKAAYSATYKSNDIQKRYAICEASVAEYPGDMEFLNNFAWATSNRSFIFEAQDEYVAEQEKAIKLFAAVIKNCGDENIRAGAVIGITQLLSWRGRRDEAKKYAELLPEKNVTTREAVWEYCLEGEELIKFKQQKLLKDFGALVGDMWFMNYADFHDKIEALYKVMFENGDYLADNLTLYQLNERLVNGLMRSSCDADAERVLTLLGQMRVYAADYDKAAHENKGVHRYTSVLFDRLETDSSTWFGVDDTALTEEFAEYLCEQKFDWLRGREDFTTLTRK